MSRRMLTHQTTSTSHRRQTETLLRSQSTAPGVGEVLGGTAAECAAVCCCFPCGVVHLLVLTLYKVPAALCRRALRNKRRAQLMKKGMLPQRLRRRSCACGCEHSEIPIHPLCSDDFSGGILQQLSSEETEKEVVQLEKEMWDMFYGTGFFRSPSARESSNNPNHPNNLTYNPSKSRFQVISLSQ